MAKLIKKTKLGNGYFKFAENITLDTDIAKIRNFLYDLDTEKLIVEIHYYQKKSSVNQGLDPTHKRIFEFTKNNDNNITNFIINELSTADFITEVGVGQIANFHKGSVDEPPIAPQTK